MNVDESDIGHPDDLALTLRHAAQIHAELNIFGVHYTPADDERSGRNA